MFSRDDKPPRVLNLLTDSWRLSHIENYLVPLSSGILAFLVYSLTLAPDLTWANYGGDGGELITAAVTLGVPHPPGYPTYVILGKLVSLVPIGTAAWRFNLFSAMGAAIAATFVTATASNVLDDRAQARIISLATGLTIALSPLLWSQAIIAEVYSLNLAVLSIYLWALLGRRSPTACGFLLGLAMTTHLSSLLMLPIGLALTPRSKLYRFVFGATVGMLPLITLPVLAKSGSPVIWGDPDTFLGWWRIVSGWIYHQNLALADSEAFIASLDRLGVTVLRQLAWIGWALVLLGITTKVLCRRLVIWLMVSIALYFCFGLLYRTVDAEVNLLPILLLAGPLLAAGFTLFGHWSLLVPVLLLFINFNSMELRNDYLVRSRANEIFTSAPQDAVLITPGDLSIAALWYYHHVEGKRDDLVLVDYNLLAFHWYRKKLSERYPDLESLEEDNIVQFRTINSRLRPVCDVPLELSGMVICSSGKQ